MAGIPVLIQTRKRLFKSSRRKRLWFRPDQHLPANGLECRYTPLTERAATQMSGNDE
ncbi:hypothetical protein RsS62_56870 [Rhizobium dioscoreae]|nr:hypothetical protein RsS62_56870 [Rhizobium dioscoreae]